MIYSVSRTAQSQDPFTDDFNQTSKSRLPSPLALTLIEQMISIVVHCICSAATPSAVCRTHSSATANSTVTIKPTNSTARLPSTRVLHARASLANRRSSTTPVSQSTAFNWTTSGPCASAFNGRALRCLADGRREREGERENPACHRAALASSVRTSMDSLESMICFRFMSQRTTRSARRSSVCDGVIDCRDASDERCTVRNPLLNCSQDEYHCEITHRCIPKTWRCNGINDCRDPFGSDELGNCCTLASSFSAHAFVARLLANGQVCLQ